MNTRRTLCVISVIVVVLLSFETCGTTETALPNVADETWDYVVLGSSIRKAEVITIDVGSADMFNAIRWHFEFSQSDRRQSEQAVEAFRETYNSMLSEVVSIASPTDTIIRIMDLYFPYVGQYKEKGINSSTKQYWMKFNECIIQTRRNGRKANPTSGLSRLLLLSRFLLIANEWGKS